MIMKSDQFRSPPRKVRIAIVFAMFAVYGFLAGAIISIFLGYMWFCSPFAALLAGYWGAKLETGSTFFDYSKESDNLNDPRPTKS